MLIKHNLTSFNAAMTAAGLVPGTDIAARDLPGTNGSIQQVLPLTMKGLRFLVWDLNYTPDDVDVQILQTNILAKIGAVGQAWTQT